MVVHQHVDGVQELLWKGRKLDYSAMEKPQRQAPTADGKEVNARVDKALAGRTTSYKPAADHPLHKMRIGRILNEGRAVL